MRAHTDTSRQRSAPHPSAAAQADQLWRPLQAVAHVARERQCVADAEVITVSPTEARRPGILARLQRVLCGKSRNGKRVLNTGLFKPHRGENQNVS